MTIRETLLFACQNDPEMVLELIALTWDAEKYKQILYEETNNTKNHQPDGNKDSNLGKTEKI